MCPSGFTSPYKGSCYLFSNVTLSWESATKKCEEYRAKLVSIETKGEQYHLILTLHSKKCQSDLEQIRLQEPLETSNYLSL